MVILDNQLDETVFITTRLELRLTRHHSMKWDFDHHLDTSQNRSEKGNYMFIDLFNISRFNSQESKSQHRPRTCTDLK